MSKRLSMYFTTAQGGRSPITIDSPKQDLSGEEVKGVMEIIINNNVFDTAKGDLLEIKSAEVVTTTKEVLI